MPGILQVVTDTDRRGAQVFATDLHDAFVRRGKRVRTVALAPGAIGGLDLPTLGTRRISLATLRALRREALTHSVVLAHGSSTLPACALGLAVTKAPFVYRQISDSRFWASSATRQLRVRLGLARAAAVVALWDGSARTVHDMFRVPESKVHVVPNGVVSARFAPAAPLERAQARRELGIPHDASVVAFVGALAPEKGPDDAVDAVAMLDGVHLLVVGDGPERTRLEQRADERAPGRVHFTGSLGDPRVGYSAADVVVLPSRGGDSMPATLIEAGLMGIPTVSTPVEGIPTIVLDGSTGRIVPIADIDAVAAACAQLLGDAGLRARYGAAAIEHCHTHFDIDVVADRWLTVVDGLTGR